MTVQGKFPIILDAKQVTLGEVVLSNLFLCSAKTAVWQSPVIPADHGTSPSFTDLRLVWSKFLWFLKQRVHLVRCVCDIIDSIMKSGVLSSKEDGREERTQHVRRRSDTWTQEAFWQTLKKGFFAVSKNLRRVVIKYLCSLSTTEGRRFVIWKGIPGIKFKQQNELLSVHFLIKPSSFLCMGQLISLKSWQNLPLVWKSCVPLIFHS